MPGGLAQFWGGLSNGQQRVLGILVLTTLALGAVMWGLTNRGGGEDAPLYSGLSAGDAAEIVQHLGKMGIPYKTGSQPGSILVPANLLAKTRMELASQGLPQSGTIGFEIFDKSPLMTTDFMQRMSYVRAVQGELSRSIASLEPVASARVHITTPQPTIFRQETPPATASVVLGLKSGQSLGSSQARGIGFLVSRAVEGLKPENIFILDSKGKVLWTGSDGSDSETDQEAAKSQVEHEVERRVQSMLDHALGVGKAVVRVSAEVNRQRREVESETFLPAEKGKGVITSQTENTEQYRAPGPGVLPPAGAAGIATNLRMSPAVGGSSGAANSYTKQQTTSQYQVSKRSEKLVDPPGTVKRLSVAVLADQGKEGGRLLALRDAIGSAAGIDQRRGDTLVLTPVEFQKSPVPKQGLPGETLELIKTIVRFVLIVIPLIAGVILLRGVLGVLQSAQMRFPHPPHEGETPALAKGEETRRLTAGRRDHDRAGRETDEQFETVRSLSQEKPDEAAEVVKLWLEEQ